ncbi:MFS transporter, partial [Burkholderia sp. SIMBA_019]
MFFAATWLLAFGFQIHTAINSGATYLRFAPATELVRYMPAFWVGFVLGVLLPQAPWLKRVPAAVLLLASALLG